MTGDSGTSNDSNRQFWKLLLLVCLVAGMILRGTNLEQKLYWYDEAFTALRISGYTEAEAVQAIPSSQVIGLEQLDIYQRLSERGLSHTVRGLAQEEPQHTPLYFVLVRIWAQIFGDSITAIRSLSVLVSLLALPAMAWLCWELFGSELAVWLGMGLLAVSPFQVIYAQEARPTALWTLTILLASAALLRALRLNRARGWWLYGGLLSLNFYAYLFSGLVAVAHAVYVAGLELRLELGLELRFTLKLRWFLSMMAFSLLLFAPWLLAVAANSSQIETVTDWLAVENRFDLMGLVKLWGYHLSLPFVDRGTLMLPLPLRLLNALAHLTVRGLILVAFYRLWRSAPLRIWLFVTTLTLVPALMLTLPDLIAGGKRSTVPRYLVPVYIGFELALTGLLSKQLMGMHSSHGRWRRYFWSGVTLLILAAGLLSSTAIAQTDIWWSKSHNQSVPFSAQQVNQTAQPLIISDAELGDLWSLRHYLDPKVKLLLRPVCYACTLNRELVDQPFLPPIPAGFSDVFLYNPRPSERWLNQLQQAPYPIRAISEGFNNWFWQIGVSQKP